jgi:hypothetical protein
VTFVCFLTRPASARPVVYTSEWVDRLWSGLRRWRTGPLRLVCFTDQPEGIRPEVETRPLPEPALTTWWARMPLFDPAVGRSISGDDPFTNVDLDTVIVGPLEWIGEVKAPFVGIRDWGSPHRMNGGLWTLTPGTCPTFPPPAFYQDTFPGRIWSYKWGHLGERKRRGPLDARPASASVIAMHGRPKMPDLAPGHWLRRAWEDAA